MTETIPGPAEALRAAVQDIMAVDDVTEGVQALDALMIHGRQPQAEQRPAVVRLRGRLLLPPDQAYRRLAERFPALGYTPLLRRGEGAGDQTILAVPGALRQARQRTRLAAGLFAATILSCLFAGAQLVDGPTAVVAVLPLLGPANINLLDGLPFAVSLLSILLAHEFGHYLVGRRLGEQVSLPYFIPVPLPPFGTMGAFISMAAPPRNRRHLLAIAVAGPLAGLALAIPILWIGLSLSRVQPLPVDLPYQLEGNSLLYLAFKYLQFGKILPSGGEDVLVHPIAFAGWAGLLVTALNLIPAGQLDGGHVAYALLGERRARQLMWVVLAALLALFLVWPGWLLWVGLIYLFGQVRLTPLDDLTEITPRQRWLAVVTLAIFPLIFVPVPLKVVVPTQPKPPGLFDQLLQSPETENSSRYAHANALLRCELDHSPGLPASDTAEI